MIDEELQKLFDEWLDYIDKEKNYSKYTIISYKNDSIGFFRFLNNYLEETINIELFEHLNAKDIRAWLSYLRIENYSNSSIRRALSTIRSFFRYLSRNHSLNNQIIFNIKQPKLGVILPKSLTKEDASSAIDTIESLSIDWTSDRDKAILTLIYCTGLRISEALSLTKSQLRNDYLVIKGKGNKERVIPIIPIVKSTIDDYLKLCPFKIENHDQIFLGKRGNILNTAVFQRQIRKLRLKLNLSDNTTPHSFRHSFASHILASGADLRSIQELLGHKNLSATQRYTNIDHERLIKAYTTAFPRK